MRLAAASHVYYDSSMRQARLVIFGIALVLGATLVACGGGGGSNAPVVSAPGNPGAPSTSPSSSATTPPTTATTPPSTTTTPPSTPTPVQTVGASNAVIHIGYGQTNGNAQTLLVSSAQNSRSYPGSGNYEPGDQGATATGGQNGNGGGGQGGAIDGVGCQPTMSQLYHVHSFVGVYSQGQEIAVPAGVGMVNPNKPDEYVVNDQPTSTPAPTQTYYGVPNQTWTANCYYDLHVHDNSGMVHMETSSNGSCGAFTSSPYPTPVNQQSPCNYPSPFTLKTLLDIWGIALTANNFGKLSGAVQIYATPAGYDSYTACPDFSNCQTSSSTYQLYIPRAALLIRTSSHHKSRCSRIRLFGLSLARRCRADCRTCTGTKVTRSSKGAKPLGLSARARSVV